MLLLFMAFLVLYRINIVFSRDAILYMKRAEVPDTQGPAKKSLKALCV